jgi:hypothetical protein
MGANAPRFSNRSQMTRLVVLVASDEVDLPVTYGILAPRVVLPREASEWSQQRCRYVLHHEMAYVTVRRRHSLVCPRRVGHFWVQSAGLVLSPPNALRTRMRMRWLRAGQWLPICALQQNSQA